LKKPTKPKKKIAAPSKTQMEIAVIDACNQDENAFVHFMDARHAVIVKRVTVTVFSVQNRGPFSYRETHEEKTFHVVFCIDWDAPLVPTIMPVFKVESPEEAKEIIESYQG
jgi:hypothetical protein